MWIISLNAQEKEEKKEGIVLRNPNTLQQLKDLAKRKTTVKTLKLRHCRNTQMHVIGTTAAH